MGYRRKDFRPDKLPERMYRQDPADLYDLYVPTPRVQRSHYYISWRLVTTSQGNEFTRSHTTRQRQHNRRVIQQALRGEE
jgi:hypothetical protein